jgi:CRP-like cAMP-binding protein
MPAKTALLTTLHQLHPLPAELRSYILENTIVQEVPKRTVLLHTGEVCQYAYFVVKGLARVYVEHGVNEVISEKYKDDESTTRFSPPGGLLMAPISFFTQTPSLEAMATLEDSLLVRFSYAMLQQGYALYPSFNIHGRLLTERYFLLAEDRVYCLRRHSAPEKWEWFKKNYAYLQGRVPLKYIATFLGISREHLQRMAEPDWRWHKNKPLNRPE